MNKFYITIPALLALSACASTSISNVGFPSPTVLHGEVKEFSESGFVLKDATGEITIDVDPAALGDTLSAGDKVTVKGVLDDDDSIGEDHVIAKEFDAYAVIPADGKEIVIVPYKANQTK